MMTTESTLSHGIDSLPPSRKSNLTGSSHYVEFLFLKEDTQVLRGSTSSTLCFESPVPFDTLDEMDLSL